MFTKIDKLIRRLLCYYGFHKWEKGYAWSANYMRFEVCPCCTEDSGGHPHRWVQDKEGWFIHERKRSIMEQRRRVIIEKIVVRKYLVNEYGEVDISNVRAIDIYDMYYNIQMLIEV